MPDDVNDAPSVDLDALRFATRPAIECLQATDDELDTDHAVHVMNAIAALADEVRLLRAKLDAARAKEWPEWSMMLTGQSCQAGKHPDWFIDSENSHPCPWCELDVLRGVSS